MKFAQRMQQHIDIGRLVVTAMVAMTIWAVLAWAAASLLIVGAELPRADALVVLSGGATYLERTHRAAQLWRQRRGSVIIVTNDGLKAGWSQEEQRTLHYFERTVAELGRLGVAMKDIRLLPDVVPGGTYGEAVHVRHYVQRLGLRSVVIVTSAYHSRRSLWTFRRVFGGTGIAVGVTTAAPGQQTPPPAIWWLYPSGWIMVVGEYVKGSYYLVRYGLSWDGGHAGMSVYPSQARRGGHGAPDCPGDR